MGFHICGATAVCYVTRGGTSVTYPRGEISAWCPQNSELQSVIPDKNDRSKQILFDLQP